MEQVDLVKILGSGGFALALLWMLRWWMTEQVKSMRDIVSSVASVGTTIREHTETDVEHHAKVYEAVARLEGKIDGAADERARSGMTPIEGVPRMPTQPGIYGIRKPRP